MKAVLFRLSDGMVSVADVPAPRPSPGSVLVQNHFSLLSTGTERARIEIGKESLISKARRRPEHARQVLESVKRVGPIETWKVVTDRLNTPILTGYSSAGTVIDVGAHVNDLRRGQLVACAGAGYANHAEVIAVPRNLCVGVPDGVTAQQAAFGTVGAIALQGVHQASLQPGSRVVVIGLGLVGQLTLQILLAYGYQTVGIDHDDGMVDLARDTGAVSFSRSATDLARRVERTLGGGADGIIVTAATNSADPVELAGIVARDRATVVIVGDVTVAPPRPSYYGKELTITYSRSYGPGRYDRLYEEAGIEYPEGYVPWDERRNLQEMLRLIANGRVDPAALKPTLFSVADVAEAYALLTATGSERRVAMLLDYDGGLENAARPTSAPIATKVGSSTSTNEKIRIAAMGAGSFATRMLLPPLARNREVAFSWIASASGVSARYQGKRWGFTRVVSGLDEGLCIRDTDAILIATRHDSHGRYAAEVLSQGLGLFCEKPLALTEGELESIAAAWNKSGARAMVGFNRRFAPSVRRLKDALGPDSGPVQIVYRVFAGRLSADHWLFQPEQGGRIIGEVCHFVDLANWLAGAPVIAVTAQGVDGSDPMRAPVCHRYDRVCGWFDCLDRLRWLHSAAGSEGTSRGRG